MMYIFLKKNGWTICKQLRPWSDTAFCGVRSGPALFASYLFKDLQSSMGEITIISVNILNFFFFFFSGKIRLDISCKLSAKQTQFQNGTDYTSLIIRVWSFVESPIHSLVKNYQALKLRKETRLAKLSTVHFNANRWLWLTVLEFNDMSTLVGHFVSSSREREKRDKRDSGGDEKEGQGRKRNRNESEETEEIKTFPLYPYLLQE